MTQLIAFTGKAGSGKTTATDVFIKNNPRMTRVSFAKKMKDAVVAMFGIDPVHIFGDKEQKEMMIPKLSTATNHVTGRKLLQTIGTDWGRNMIDPDIWIMDIADKWASQKNIPGFAGMVIEDLRFDNEAAWVKSQGGIIIELLSPADYERNATASDQHISEGGINPSYVDIRIVNRKVSPDQLFDEIGCELHHYGLKLKDIRARRVEDRVESVQELITAWANEVFPGRTITNALQKMVMEEIPEYLTAQDDPLELADIAILLYDIAYLANVDLDAAIREKMEINKKRTWEISEETGLMRHITDANDILGDVPLIIRQRVGSHLNEPVSFSGISTSPVKDVPLILQPRTGSHYDGIDGAHCNVNEGIDII